MSRSPGGTLLAVFSHPDDEVAAAGTLLAQRARGDRVFVLWLTRGEMTEAFGPLPTDEVARLRTRLGAEAAAILDVEHRFLDFPDTRIEASPGAAEDVAQVVCEVKPDGLLTWGSSWVRGVRHPDHEATGKIARDAVTLARIAKRMAPTLPHRARCPVFTYRDVHSTLPAVAVDVAPHLDRIRELGAFYHDELGFGEPEWLARRLRRAGAPFGLGYAEVFDAWESQAGVVPSLLPAGPGELDLHPDRPRNP
jgi:LmbE family N-acetylglucosaminyl deacetylase